MKLIKLLLLSSVPYISTYLGLYKFSNAWLAILGYHLIIILVVFLKKNELTNIKFIIVTNKKFFLLGLTLTILLLPLLLFMWDYIKITNIDLTLILSQLKLNDLSFQIFIIYFFTVHPILEELYWRYIITYKKNIKIDYLFDVLFAGYHILVLMLFVKIPFVILSFVTLAITGMLWRFIKNHYDDHLTILISHSLADFSIIIAIYLLSI